MNRLVDKTFTEARYAVLDLIPHWDARRRDAYIELIVDIEYKAESGWEPVTYDEYSEKGGWTYRTVSQDATERFYFYRHIATGKIYRRNQQRRIWAWNNGQKLLAQSKADHEVYVAVNQPLEG